MSNETPSLNNDNNLNENDKQSTASAGATTPTQGTFPAFTQVKREPSHRVFVNRSLQLSKIKFFGFDMDYTLALYKSPQYEILAFNLVIDQLLRIGYPSDIKNFVYDPTFPVSNDTGVRSGDIFVTFKAIFQDVRHAIDYVHNVGDLKRLTVENMDEYVVKDDRLATLFDRMHENNVKVFLLTNSGYEYTDKIMGFLLNNQTNGRHWRSYFDYILVDAKKPLFFAEGTSLKEIDINTGIKKFGCHAGPLRENQVYSGGSCDVFSKLIGSRGKDVLYVGDHIFGDIIKSKKERAWRTFLIIPELSKELSVWHEKRGIFTEIEQLDKILSQRQIDLDSSSKTCPANISDIKYQIQKCVHEMDMQYGLLGSLFRTGSRQTHFASQASRYADIYAASHLNLLHYPFFYLFKAPPQLMPHESTVNPYAGGDDFNMIPKSRGSSINNLESSLTTTHSSEVSALVNNASNVFNPDFKKLSPLTVSNKNIFFGSSATTTNTTNNNLTNGKTDGLEETESSTPTSSLIKPEQPETLTHYEDFDDDDEDSDDSKTSNNQSTSPPPTPSISI